MAGIDIDPSFDPNRFMQKIQLLLLWILGIAWLCISLYADWRSSYINMFVSVYAVIAVMYFGIRSISLQHGGRFWTLPSIWVHVVMTLFFSHVMYENIPEWGVLLWVPFQASVVLTLVLLERAGYWPRKPDA